MKKVILIISLLLPLLVLSQKTEVKPNESYFIDEYDNYHNGVGHTYEYLTIAKYNYSSKSYKIVQQDWVKKTFSLYFDFFFDGEGNKYFYNLNTESSSKGNFVFDLQNGDRIILYNNKDMWYLSEYNGNTGKYESLGKFSKVSKSRWLDY